MQNIQDITRSEKSSVTAAFKTIFSIWYKRLPALLFGIFISLIAVLLGLALMSFAGGKVALTAMGAIITSSLFLKMVGVSRMIMRYVERLFTHNAMFHALADLRIWFFRTLAMGSARSEERRASYFTVFWFHIDIFCAFYNYSPL